MMPAKQPTTYRPMLTAIALVVALRAIAACQSGPAVQYYLATPYQPAAESSFAP